MRRCVPFNPEVDFLQWKWTPESKLVILTGAGISAESGIPTFRDNNDGLWTKYPLDKVATPEGYAADPKLAIEFHNVLRETCAVEPNNGHSAIARLQKELNGQSYLVTQNIDDLHERGGSPQVTHMHGEINSVFCLGDERHVFDWTCPQKVDELCKKCNAILRPDVVWFGEMPYDTDTIEKKLEECTHFIFIGTSSLVYPAAGYKTLARASGAKVMCVDIDPNLQDFDCDYYLKGKAGETLPNFVEKWMNFVSRG